MRYLLLLLIRLYQRFLSPIKGFSCAFRAYRGGASCSTHGYRVVKRYGARVGILLIRRRMKLCGQAHAAHQRSRYSVARTYRHKYQSGHCDVPCDCGIDFNSPCDVSDFCNVPCSCDWPTRKKSKEELWVDIKPTSDLSKPRGR
jgi:putative component of membrane protein insertase Oxa1/YidC/SpoIIIJ protein YidD